MPGATMPSDLPELSEPAAPAKAAPDVLAPQMSRWTAAWGLLILAGGLVAYYRAGHAICDWWFAPGRPDEFRQTAFYFSLLLVLAVLLTFVLVGWRDLRHLGFSRENITAQLSWAVFAVACTYAFEILAVVPYWLWFRPPGDVGNPVAKTLFAAAATEDYVGAVVLVILIGAAAEELLFRGLLLRYLNGLFRGPWLAILISAAIFGLAHLRSDYFNALIAFWMGTVLGTIYVRRASLLTVVVAHFLFNFSNLLLVPAIWSTG